MERYRTTLILLGALVLLVAAWFFLRSNPSVTSSATPTPEATTYVWQEPGTVDAIDVISGTSTVSVRQDMSSTVWSLTVPISATADVTQVGTSADSLKTLAATAVLTNVTDLSQYGLDKSDFTVKFTTAGTSPASHSFKVGHATIDGAGYYIQPDGNKNVYIIANTLVEQLRSWVTTPPKAQPTATPVPTLPPSPSASTTITGTSTVTLTLPLSPTAGLSGSATITSTSPGAANPTTPAPSSTP